MTNTILPAASTLIFILQSFFLFGQNGYLLLPEQVFDGVDLHKDWAVLVEGNTIKWVGHQDDIKSTEETNTIRLDNCTLLPGLIEGHSHLLLHPYNETSWNDQVLKESEAERAIRASVHAQKSLMAGITTMRDLGAEGAGYADVGVKQAIQKGVIPGPRLIVAGPAIVATGSYGPKGFASHVQVPLGAEVADGTDHLLKVVRRQIGGGADVVKVYADYRWGPFGQAMPTFSIDELTLIVETAASSGRQVVAHAATAEGMRRAIMAGVSTIEHGDVGTPDIFKLMAEKGVALCPTLAAGDAIMQYNGWKKGIAADPVRIIQKKKSFKQALDAGVIICAGGDVGVFPHGDNVRELEMMVDYGMTSLETLRSATSINAEVFNRADQIGQIKKDLLADILVVEGNPLDNISDLRSVVLVIKDGIIVVQKER